MLSKRVDHVAVPGGRTLRKEICAYSLSCYSVTTLSRRVDVVRCDHAAVIPMCVGTRDLMNQLFQ